jgi:hypothetical protein
MLIDRMSKIDRYLQAIEYCSSNAQVAATDEIRRLWTTIAESYQFLVALEKRPDKPSNLLHDIHRTARANGHPSARQHLSRLRGARISQR